MTHEDYCLVTDAIVAAHKVGLDTGRSIERRTFDSDNIPSAFDTPEWKKVVKARGLS
jgi:hypothetical protein